MVGGLRGGGGGGGAVWNFFSHLQLAKLFIIANDNFYVIIGMSMHAISPC